MSRIQKSVKNIYISTTCYIINVLMSFVVRTVFIKVLSVEYLGVNGLFSNILTILSLAELGVGSAIIYALYQPLADDDTESIKTYMNIYRRAYMIIGVVVASVGILLLPFLPYLISGDTDINHLSIIYILFVLNSASSYFLSYNQSLLNADQKVYIVKKQVEIFKFISQVLQIIFLFLTKEYLIYLIISVLCTVSTNIALYIKTMKLYPYLKDKDSLPLEEKEKSKLVVNVKSLFLHKIGAMLVYNVDIIIISAFLGITIVGIYSNYTMIIAAVMGVIVIVENSVRASLGNYIAKESEEDSYRMFKFTDFIWFLVYLFFTICLINLMNPFIGDLWIKDEQYLLSSWEVLIIGLNFFVTGLRKNVLLYKELYGVFAPDRYKPLFEGIANLILSLILVKVIGLSGVLIATIMTNFMVCFTVEPYVLFKYGLKQDVREYYFSLFLKLVVSSILIYISLVLNNLINVSGMLAFIARGGVCTLVFVVGVTLFYFKSEYLKQGVYFFRRLIVMIR